MVSGSISLPLPGFFSPFPHGTCSLSVAAEYLALDRGRPGFRQGFSCPAVLRYRIMETHSFRLRGSHALRPAFPCRSPMNGFSINSTGHPHAALQPHSRWFGLLRVRSPLLAESLLFSIPGLLRWFTSPGVAPPAYFIRLMRCRDRSLRVTPFGSPRINGYVLLPAAYRSLSRPSSSGSSKASAMDLYFAWPYYLFRSVPLSPPQHPLSSIRFGDSRSRSLFVVFTSAAGLSSRRSYVSLPLLCQRTNHLVFYNLVKFLSHLAEKGKKEELN